MKKKKLETSYQDSGYYFDDCSICETMRKAEETGHNLFEEELHEAFEQANKEEKK